MESGLFRKGANEKCLLEFVLQMRDIRDKPACISIVLSAA